MVTLSSVRSPVVEPRRRMRTWWVPPAVRSNWLNRWTTQTPSSPATSVVSVPGGAVNAAVNAIVAGALADAADLTSWGSLFSAPPRSAATRAKTRYSYGVPSTRLGSESEYVVASRTRKISANAPPGARRSTLKSVAVAETLSQRRSIWLMLTGVATKFSGAAGKTVALDSFESSKFECCSASTARTRYMNVTPSCKSDDASVARAAPVGERVAWTGNTTGSPFSRVRSISKEISAALGSVLVHLSDTL